MAEEGSGSQGKRFCGTLFFDDEFEARVFFEQLPALSGDGEISQLGLYGGGQLEACPTTGRVHLQFFCGFKSNWRWER